jgi:hypothetical protein
MRIAAALLILAPQSGPVQVDEKAGTVSFAAVVVKPDLQPRLEGFVEYVLVNKGGSSGRTSTRGRSTRG